MRRVEEITGEARVAQNIARALTEGGHRVAAIVGPEGSGKSRTAALVGLELQANYRIVLRRGEALLAGSPEAMLIGGPARPSTEQVGGAVLDVAQDVAELIADGHIPFSRTLRRLFKLKSKLDKSQRLTERQQAFIFELAAIRSAKHALLVADNLHSWDSESLNFLAQIRNGLWDRVYPNLRQVRVVLVWTPEQAASGFEAKVKQLFGREVPLEELKHIDPTEFRELLIALGAPETIPDDLFAQIYAVSGGHLLFAAQIVGLLRSGSVDTATRSANTGDLTEALRTTIEARLDAAGPFGGVLCRLIQALSIIGETVKPHDLACVLPDDRERLEWILNQACRLGFIERNAEEINIAHEVIRRVFLTFLTPNQRDWHQRFADCLSKLRPWDYSRRSVHLSAAGRVEAAEVMRVMALLQGLRDMRIAPNDNWGLLAGPLSNPVLSFLGALQHAASAEVERRYDDAIHHLEDVPIGISSLLLAERDLILSRLLLLKRTTASYERGVALLEDLGTLRDEEPDLWSRIEEVRIVLLAYLGRLDDARRIEATLRVFFQERRAFDPVAAHAENRLRRKAESLHAPRIANDRLKRALAYFDPTGDGSNPRDLVEYLLTLNNLGANELVLGDFEAAFQRFAQCCRAIESAGRPVVKRVEIVLSNLVVAHFLRTGVIPESIAVLAELTEGMDVLSSDGSLVRSNIGALLASQGNPVEARSVLSSAAERILAVPDFSPYSIYFLFSNLAVVEWLNGADLAGSSAFRQSLASLDTLDLDLKPYARRRLEILEQQLVASGVRQLGGLTASFEPLQVGEGWRLYGRPLAFTDLQFWTEN